MEVSLSSSVKYRLLRHDVGCCLRRKIYSSAATGSIGHSRVRHGLVLVGRLLLLLMLRLTALRSAAALPLHDGQEQFELGRQFLLGVQPIREVYPSNATIGVDLHSERFDVIRPVRSPREVGKVELDLIPTLVESHGHGTYERLHSRRALIVRRAESSTDVLVVEDLYLEGEVLLEILEYHDEERQFDTQRLLRLGGTDDVIRGDVGSHDLQNGRLDVRVGDSLDVSVSNGGVPYLQGLRPNGIEDRKESALERVAEHDSIDW